MPGHAERRVRLDCRQLGSYPAESVTSKLPVIYAKRKLAWLLLALLPYSRGSNHAERTRPMLGFKRFDHAAVTIGGIELAQKIQKQQFKTDKLGGRSATMPELWSAVLAA